MTNLIIIGNGFDLAHGLKTSYNDFIKFIINHKLKFNSDYNDLIIIDYKPTSVRRYDQFIEGLQNKTVRLRSKTNPFFSYLIENHANGNWCDIEKEYYEFLTNLAKWNYRSAESLNKDFEILKNYLQQYLESQDHANQIKAYQVFFEKMDSKNNLVINFNYTKTLKNYKTQELRILNFHGEINSEENPIIFGYAASHDQSRELLKKDDRLEHMKNIKRHAYKRTRNEDLLRRYLQDHDKIELSIIGHSIGLSDEQILHDLFNDENVKRIRIFYHLGYKNYDQSKINLDYIMNNYQNFSKKLVNFQDCIMMPQYSDEDIPSEFRISLNNMIHCQEEIYIREA